jgi:hypothetical protein
MSSACTAFWKRWIAKAISGQLEVDFLTDEMLRYRYAVARKLTIIGEAVARLMPAHRRDEKVQGKETAGWVPLGLNLLTMKIIKLGTSQLSHYPFRSIDV